MREKKDYMILTFATTSAAMLMEKVCGQQEIPGRLIPVPTQITAGCGLAWRMTPAEYEENAARIEATEVPVEQKIQLKL